MAELLVGIAFMPAGQRRKRLADNLDALLTLPEGRVLAFDAGAARRYPELCVIARRRRSMERTAYRSSSPTV